MRRFFLPFLTILLLLGGCMSEEEQLVGKWRGKVELSAAIKSSPMGAMAGSYMSLVDPQLDLRPDKTFVLSLSMAPVEGTWTLKDQEIILTPKKVMGMSAGQARKQVENAMDRAPKGIPLPFGADMIPDTKEMRVKVLDHGQKLTLDPAAGTMLGGFGKMTFTKV